MRLFSGTFAALSILFLIIPFAQAEEGAQDQAPHCVIAAIDGEGTAKVRRQSGIEQFASKEMKIFAGDKITTDASVAVSLFFPDGSVIKVGTNSEYKLSSIAEKNKVISWFSDLMRGSVRAIIENLNVKKKSQYRLSTPEGTIGVRGTDFVLQHDPVSKASEFYLLEGRVEAGPLGCFEKNNCTMLNGGQRVEFRDKKMSAPRTFRASDFVGVSHSSPEAKSTQLASERLALVEDLKQLAGAKARLQGKNDEDVREELSALELKLRAMQAELLGVDVEMLNKLHKDEKAGLLKNRMAAAERFLKMADILEGGEVALDTRRLALGRALSEHSDFNGGKFDRNAARRMSKDDTIAAYTDIPLSKLPQQEESSKGWRAAAAQGNRVNYAPSGAIQNQMKSVSINSAKNVPQPNSRLVNRGGILINEGAIDDKSKATLGLKEKTMKPAPSASSSNAGSSQQSAPRETASAGGSQQASATQAPSGAPATGGGGGSNSGTCYQFSRCNSGGSLFGSILRALF